MLSFAIPAKTLRPFVPRGTEIDFFEGKAMVTLAGLLFQNAKVFGLRIPGFSAFEGVNLRFYVRRKFGQGYRRGVVRIREFVPSRVLTTASRFFFNEKACAVPMRHQFCGNDQKDRKDMSVSYQWQFRRGWSSLLLQTGERPATAVQGSAAAFVTEPQWGYARFRDGSTAEYEIDHPRWRIWEAKRAKLEGNLFSQFGAVFQECLSNEPVSAFLVEGSRVTVRSPAPIS